MNPAELKRKIDIYSVHSIRNASGGSTPSVICAYPMLSTRAKKEPVRVNNQLAIEAGASVLNEDCIFTIRDRAEFVPVKNMLLECDGSKYTLVAFYNPEKYPNYLRLVGVRKKEGATK